MHAGQLSRRLLGSGVPQNGQKMTSAPSTFFPQQLHTMLIIFPSLYGLIFCSSRGCTGIIVSNLQAFVHRVNDPDRKESAVHVASGLRMVYLCGFAVIIP